ncbi:MULTISPECIES: hypothetical protein [Gordonia]|uniref:hypothetical protein n=1 Tax=Gordonia TaxID=2053 RepID=UPI00257B79E3|nr:MULTISPECIES: hypothetical protein [Gordonia]
MTDTAHDPTHLGALETGYEEGHNDAVIALRRAIHQIGLDPDNRDALLRNVESDYGNPFTKLFDDRREYVREQVSNAFGTIVDEDGDDLFDGEVIDAILDAHADWLAAREDICTADPCVLRPGHDGECRR